VLPNFYAPPQTDNRADSRIIAPPIVRGGLSLSLTNKQAIVITDRIFGDVIFILRAGSKRHVRIVAPKLYSITQAGAGDALDRNCILLGAMQCNRLMIADIRGGSCEVIQVGFQPKNSLFIIAPFGRYAIKRRRLAASSSSPQPTFKDETCSPNRD